MRSRFVAIVLFGLAVLTPKLLAAQNSDSDNPQALMQVGQAKLACVGALAQQGQFGPANELLQSAMADMDRAIALAPGDIDLRLARGIAYGLFPSYLNKGDVARADLEIAARDPTFQASTDAQHTRATQILERLRGAGGAHAHPDRFPNIAADASPIIAAASVTFANVEPGHTPAWLGYVMKGVESVPGLLGTHVVASLDHQGMFIIFTWWKSKQALNDFYYSDIHQGWMTGRGQGMTGTRKPEPQDIPSQVGIEVFTSLPGGTRMNGGFIPPDLKR
jgi:heme-degrading monooxygenase HmoA